MNPLLERVLANFDKNQNNEIEFIGLKMLLYNNSEFISGLSLFLQKGNKESKLQCKINSKQLHFSYFFYL